MIVKASQRGDGQDMATHFLNSFDNEVVEILEMYGFVSDDPHGAMAEIQLQADTMTKCKQPFYSVAVNPDPEQPRWTEEMRIDHRDRMFKKLGLEGQAFIAFKHIKHQREHYHYAISRINVETGKAIQLSFDKDKQMMVTRQFARDWGIELAEGYSKEKGQHKGRDQLMLHEKRQEETTGITKEERMKIVTDLWRQSDTAQAFNAGLEEHGYILCTGKRDYVLVDQYGKMNSLPKLIDDKQVRTADLRARLAQDFPKDQLPDVEETKKHIDEHRRETEKFDEFGGITFKLDQLEWSHKRKRADLERKCEDLTKRQDTEKETLTSHQTDQRAKLRNEYLERQRQIRQEREQKQPTGLSAILARYSGFEKMQALRQRRQDKQRFEAFQQQKNTLLEQQKAEAQNLRLQQQAHTDEIQRRFQSFEKVAKREKQALQIQQLKLQRTYQRKGPQPLPEPILQLSPWRGRQPNIHKAKQKYVDPLQPKKQAVERPKTQANNMGKGNLLKQEVERRKPANTEPVKLQRDFDSNSVKVRPVPQPQKPPVRKVQPKTENDLALKR